MTAAHDRVSRRSCSELWRWRESRTARRRLLLYMSSISLGVAALVAIDSFSANIIQSVHDQSRALLGGDISFDSSQRRFQRRSIRCSIRSRTTGCARAA